MLFGLFPSRKCLYRCGFPSRQWPEVIAGRMACRVILNTSVSVPVMPKVTFELKPPSHLLREAQWGNSLITIIRVDQISHLIQGGSFYRLMLEVTWHVNGAFDAQDMSLPVHLPLISGFQWEQFYFPGDVFSVWRHSCLSQPRSCPVCKGQGNY